LLVVISINETLDDYWEFNLDGEILASQSDHPEYEYFYDFNLFIKEEIQEHTFWVNVYPNNTHSEGHQTSEEADRQQSRNTRIGKLKFTYTEEDLIK
jgi:hypothetical protein